MFSFSLFVFVVRIQDLRSPVQRQHFSRKLLILLGSAPGISVSALRGNAEGNSTIAMEIRPAGGFRGESGNSAIRNPTNPEIRNSAQACAPSMAPCGVKWQRRSHVSIFLTRAAPGDASPIGPFFPRRCHVTPIFPRRCYVSPRLPRFPNLDPRHENRNMRATPPRHPTGLHGRSGWGEVSQGSPRNR